MFLRDPAPGAVHLFYTLMLPLSRGESFLENRVFSRPRRGRMTSPASTSRNRRDFVKHSDRGVFDPLSLAARPTRPTAAHGRVTEVVGPAGRGRPIGPTRGRPPPRAPTRRQLHRLRPAGAAADAFPDRARTEIERRVGKLWERRPEPERSAATSSCSGWSPACRSPASPVSARGRASPTSGALGLLSNNILPPLMAEREPSSRLVGSNNSLILFYSRNRLGNTAGRARWMAARRSHRSSRRAACAERLRIVCPRAASASKGGAYPNVDPVNTRHSGGRSTAGTSRS